MKGVLDRIEDGSHAVILIEEINKEIIIPKEQLPSRSEVHSWFDLTIEGNTITSIKVDESTTKIQKNKAEDLMNKLRAKSKGSKFKRN